MQTNPVPEPKFLNPTCSVRSGPCFCECGSSGWEGLGFGPLATERPRALSNAGAHQAGKGREGFEPSSQVIIYSVISYHFVSLACYALVAKKKIPGRSKRRSIRSTLRAVFYSAGFRGFHELNRRAEAQDQFGLQRPAQQKDPSPRPSRPLDSLPRWCWAPPPSPMLLIAAPHARLERLTNSRGDLAMPRIFHFEGFSGSGREARKSAGYEPEGVHPPQSFPCMLHPTSEIRNPEP